MTRRRYELGKRADAAAATRRRILDAAWSEIERAGYRPVSIERVAVRARVTRMTVYRHFPTRGALFEAVMWDQLQRAHLERLDAARALPDVVEAARAFLREQCRLLEEIGPAMRATLNVEHEEPEVAALLRLGYRGRRRESLLELAERIATSNRVAPGWSTDDIWAALTILTSFETHEVLTRDHGRSVDEAASMLFSLAGAFLEHNGS